MAEEIYTTRSGYTPHMSPYQIRQQKKKALQSYRHITTIQKNAESEATKSADEAEDKLNKFIISGSQSHGK